MCCMSSSKVVEKLENIVKSLDKDVCIDMSTECKETADGFRRINKTLDSL